MNNPLSVGRVIELAHRNEVRRSQIRRSVALINTLIHNIVGHIKAGSARRRRTLVRRAPATATAASNNLPAERLEPEHDNRGFIGPTAGPKRPQGCRWCLERAAAEACRPGRLRRAPAGVIVSLALHLFL
jgi:hypothetical protein